MPTHFDPFSQAIMLDPYEHYRWLRETSPVYHVPDTDIWAVSRYADVEYVLRNHQVFSSTGGVGPEWDPHPMLSMYDPPEHTRLRRLIAGRFTPKFVASFTDRMTETTERLLAPMLDAGGGDFVTDFAQPLVASLMADLLGIPEDRRDDFRRWSTGIIDTLTSRHDAAAAATAERTRVEFVSYLRQLIAQRQSSAPTSDIISLLLHANEREVLTAKEVLAFSVLLLVAGYETTVNGLANIMNALTTFPSTFGELRTDASLIPTVIEEALRWDSPDQSFFRNTLTETELEGVAIPARAKVMVLFGSANRDSAAFTNPDQLDLHRPQKDHLAFGAGVHYCIGAPIARCQYAVVLRALVDRVARLESAGAPERIVTVITRGFRTLPMALRPM